MIRSSKDFYTNTTRADLIRARSLISALTDDVIMASASIPGAFPPVMINVEVEGKAYQEMHVDGGATAQVFVVGFRLAGKDPVWQKVPPDFQGLSQSEK